MIEQDDQDKPRDAWSDERPRLEQLGRLPISGNVVDDPNVEKSLELLADKIEQMITVVNAIARAIAERP